METLIHQSKRIKIEHSYACLEDLKLELISVKQEDPLGLSEENDVGHNMKIEISDDLDNLVKTEPTETVGDEDTKNHFEYLNVPYESEHEIPPDDQNTVTNQNISGTGNANISTSAVSEVTAVASEDPLILAKNEVQVEDKTKKSRPKRKRKANSYLNTSTPEATTVPLNKYVRLGKEKENLQKQIAKLKADLKSVVGREKALQTELGARRMSELSLEGKNTELQNQLTESTQKLKINTKLVKELSQKVVQVEGELSIKSAYTEQLRKDLNLKLQKAKDQLKRKQSQQKKSALDDRQRKVENLTVQLKMKEMQHKQLDFKCEELSHANTRLSVRFEAQKNELERTKKELLTVTQALANSVESSHNLNRRIDELTKNLALVRSSKEELQKALLAEKQMSRLLVKERDDLLQSQNAKFQKVEKDVVKHRLIIESLTSALTQKLSECRMQKEAVKLLKLNQQKRVLELKTQMIELEKREEELKNKTCEYCGFS